MSTFTQNNHGGKGVQIFSSDQSHKFTQNGGGIKIIDRKIHCTNNDNVNITKTATSDSTFTQNNNMK